MLLVLDLPPGGTSPPVASMAREEKKRAASAATEKAARSADRRPLYFAAFLVLADAALVALVIAFVRCL